MGQEIIEGNKLIAEFMGAKYWPRSYKIMVKYSDAYEFPNGIAFGENGLKYHSSWDWLMPVIDKIEDMGFSISLEKHQAQVFDKAKNYPENFIIDADFRNTKIENAFDAVIAFIEYYNKNNTTQ